MAQFLSKLRNLSKNMLGISGGGTRIILLSCDGILVKIES